MTLAERAANAIAAVLCDCCSVEEIENTLLPINPADWQRAAEEVLAVVIADDEAMSRARHAYLTSPPHGTKHSHAARLEHMRAAFRAAFAERTP
jgi:predicted RNA methylase